MDWKKFLVFSWKRGHVKALFVHVLDFKLYTLLNAVKIHFYNVFYTQNVVFSNKKCLFKSKE